MSLIRHYDAATAPKGLLRHILPIFGYPALIWHNRYMVQNFLRRDLMSRVHGSYLGIYWLLLQPMFQFVLYFLVFGLIFNAGADVGYAIYLFTGVIVFASMTEATSQCCQIVVDNGNLVKKVAFPSETLPVTSSAVSLIIYLVGALLALVVGLCAGVLQPSWLLLAWPLVLFVQFSMTLGIGLLLANAYVFVRDVAQLWRLALMAWQFLSPVFWRPAQVEGVLPAWGVTLLHNANPAYPLIMAHRLVLGGTHPMLGEFWSQLGIAAVWALGFMVLGYSSFLSNKHKYADLI